MSTIKEIREIRLKKLKAIRNAGFLAYPGTVKRTHACYEALKNFEELSRKNTEIFLTGRMMSSRQHGGLTFINIKDGSGQIQLLLKKDKVGKKGYQFFLEHFDIGDFIEVRGTLFLTKRNEMTLSIVDYKMISKSLLPLPEKWHGLKDAEDRYRKRYLDILFDPEVKNMIEKRSVFWRSTRDFLIKRKFMEVETPVLETTPGGADAKPFITHYNALDINVYLRISMGELWQKRLMVAGFEKTFEIGRQFRNEGMDAEHLQDYTQMEFYMAYASYKQGMELVEEMYKYIAKKTFGTLKFKIRGFDVDFEKEWERYDYASMISKYTGINIMEASLPEMEKTLKKLNIGYEKKGFNRARAMDSLWKFCRKKIAGPGFLINTPIEVSPLAKENEKNPKLVQRFQVIIAGSENGNGYSELNDPIEQAQRFKEQQKLRDMGDEEAQMYDEDFIEALEYGMPPTCGFGFSERLFSFLMDKPARECQIFPLMRPK
ncbi:MAG: lysine--tRNA ligase [Candidatus Pacebacteria bacterium]|nr:lysine--tRNA ligase [Candidatus Paceibacterota bacterium]MDD4201170.1 lysine--tRNA ligase [Candidatus Paceibacterota bacterium]MDD4897253.1 lysine--tRNA ligase [Candidatus Paceibacterota bacterium]